jgi:hypothetical protein
MSALGLYSSCISGPKLAPFAQASIFAAAPPSNYFLRLCPQEKKPDVVVLGWRSYTWSVVVRPVGRTTKFSTTRLEAAYGREISNSSGGHSCSEQCHLHTSLKTWELCGVVLFDKTAHFRVAPSSRCTCVITMLFNQLLDIPHLSGGWIILAKEECSITGM